MLLVFLNISGLIRGSPTGAFPNHQEAPVAIKDPQYRCHVMHVEKRPVWSLGDLRQQRGFLAGSRRQKFSTRPCAVRDDGHLRLALLPGRPAEGLEDDLSPDLLELLGPGHPRTSITRSWGAQNLGVEGLRTQKPQDARTRGLWKNL